MLKVMIAEDEAMIADLLEETFIESGYEVCGLAATVAESIALALLHKLDLAIIDLRLADGGLVTEIVAELDIRSIGIVYATVNMQQLMKHVIRGDACIAKPYRLEDMVRALEIVSGLMATGVAKPPFPAGCKLLSCNHRPDHETARVCG